MGTTPDRARPPAAGIARKLAAILSADVQGFSRLMDAEEETTLHTLNACREVIDALIQHHRGRIVGTAGDSVLAEFASVIDAVRCAVEIQQQLKTRNADLPAQRRMEFRIGINLGDVMVDGDQIYGDGVNVAARLQSLADAGGVFIAGTVYDHIENKLTLSYEYLGEQLVKNITKPVRVYRLVMEESESQKAQGKRQKAKVDRQTQRKVGTARLRWVAAGLVLVAAALVAVQYLSRPALSPQPLALSPATTPAALPLPDKPSIVVLPFDNMSKDPEQDYFSNGITEVLTSDLSRISSLFVIARNTAFTYKGKAANVHGIGKELGVRYVLEGSVQKASDQVRIVAQLVDTTTDTHVWSERFDRPFTDIFALQDEIVQKIVTTLKLQLTLEEQGYIVRKHTDNLQAYDAFLRGMEYYSRFTQEATIQARQVFEKALALDPQYAEADAMLGYTYWRETVFRWSADPQNLERALALAQQALALDDSVPLAHSLLSQVYELKQQYDQALAEGERAIALDPNNADSYAGHAEVLNLAGRPEDALKMVAQAMRLNPRYPFWYLFEVGYAYRTTGQYTEAIATLKESISRNPNFIYAHLNLALSYLWQWLSQQSPAAQTLEPAVAAVQRALALNDFLHWNHIVLGYLSLFQQQYEQALSEMERAVALGPAEAESYAALAEVLSRGGKSEEALEAAAQALRLKSQLGTTLAANVATAYELAGHHEEARTLLQRFLSRYPNFLPAHLTLAVVYSELGQAAEAQAEAATVLRLNPNFSLEVHRQREPIKDPTVLEHYLAALRKAGLK
jgi:adenylate cyclase